MIDRDATLFDITEQYPETIPVFVSRGFPQLADPEQRRRLGKSISLSSALLLKQMDADAFLRLLEEAVKNGGEQADVTLNSSSAERELSGDALSVVGILPCPVRLPLMENWDSFLQDFHSSSRRGIRHELKAASMGLDWVQENIEGARNADDLPDLFVSAGFDMFFDEKRIGRFRREGVFADLSGLSEDNPDFADLDLRDPEGRYTIISVVPAMFLVNSDELGDRDAPRTWEDLLHPRFERSVSLPVGDFDLFNAILLNIHKEFGDDGVRALGRNLLSSMHPSQMVKSGTRNTGRPAVTIMPYFFSRMARAGGSMKAIWPDDGAIISPIFMLSKAARADELQPVVDFFASRETGEVLSGQGLFPSTHPEVRNELPPGSRFRWLGWDYIAANDLSAVISRCEALFNEQAAEVPA